MPVKPINVATVGYGFSAKIFHIPLILAIPAFHLYGIVQRSPTPSNSATTDFPAAKIWSSADEMLTDPNVDLVILTTLPESHFALAKAALEAGKHVVVEKPFVPTSAEAEELCAIAKRSGKLLTVYQNRRWDADFVTAKKLIQDGILGRVVEFHTHFDRYAPVNQGGWQQKAGPGVGQIFDLGAHLLDQVVHLFGLPRTAFAVIGNQRADGDEKGDPGDSFTVLMTYASGLVVTAKASQLSCEEEQPRFWIRGDKGSWKKYGLDCQEDQLIAGMKAEDKEFGKEPADCYGTLTRVIDGKPKKEVYPTAEEQTWVDYYRTMAKAIAGLGEVPVKPEDSAGVIRLIELLKESSKEGKAVSF